jgi:hypothetical protein
MADLTIYETGSGGDFYLNGSDLSTTQAGLFEMVYMAWFGGNPEADTTGNEIPSEIREDWFGNALIFNNEKSIQFNSQLERALITTALSSAGRISIEEAAKADLEFMSEIANIDVSVSILSDDKISIFVSMTEPDNLQKKDFQLIWDGVKNEIIIEKNI